MRDTWYVIDFILCLWIWLDFFRIYQRRYRITLDRWLFSYYRFFIILLFFDQWNGFSFNRSIFTFCVLCSYDRDPQGPQCNNSLSDILSARSLLLCFNCSFQNKVFTVCFVNCSFKNKSFLSTKLRMSSAKNKKPTKRNFFSIPLFS